GSADRQQRSEGGKTRPACGQHCALPPLRFLARGSRGPRPLVATLTSVKHTEGCFAALPCFKNAYPFLDDSCASFQLKVLDHRRGFCPRSGMFFRLVLFTAFSKLKRQSPP